MSLSLQVYHTQRTSINYYKSLTQHPFASSLTEPPRLTPNRTRSSWEHIDVERRVWRIPSTNSKSGKVRAVPLNNSAIGVLNRLDTEGEFEHVFINRKTGKPYTTIQKVWNRLRNAAGLGHVRIHDLRHSYASMLVNSGRTLYEVQQILGHSNPKVTQLYSHLSTATLQEAASSAADLINEAMKKSA